MSGRVLFVVGAQTGIGKTHVACGLLRAARQQGWSIDALKPVVSCFDPSTPLESDPGRLLEAMDTPVSGPALDVLTPWRFAAPLAPPMAAVREGRALPMAEVVDFCRRRIAGSPAELMIVEGVGGLMSPIADGGTSLDLLEALACWSVLVGGGYLGAVSHTLTALEVMRARGVAPGAVLVSEAADPYAPDFWETVTLIAEYAEPTPVIPLARCARYDWARLSLSAVFTPRAYLAGRGRCRN